MVYVYMHHTETLPSKSYKNAPTFTGKATVLFQQMTYTDAYINSISVHTMQIPTIPTC